MMCQMLQQWQTLPVMMMIDATSFLKDLSAGNRTTHNMRQHNVMRGEINTIIHPLNAPRPSSGGKTGAVIVLKPK
jgi:hypothetical protein